MEEIVSNWTLSQEKIPEYLLVTDFPGLLKKEPLSVRISDRVARLFHESRPGMSASEDLGVLGPRSLRHNVQGRLGVESLGLPGGTAGFTKKITHNCMNASFTPELFNYLL